jgi:hypothetical protein
MCHALKITNVYKFANGMVIVFDQHGQQMPEYQGRYEDVIDKIRAAYDGPIDERSWSTPGRAWPWQS